MVMVRQMMLFLHNLPKNYPGDWDDLRFLKFHCERDSFWVCCRQVADEQWETILETIVSLQVLEREVSHRDKNYLKETNF